MADGVRLAVTLYLPDASAGPQPCILEALPYRKDDLTSSYEPEYLRLCDEYRYAVARLDLRGTGSSGGVATDEYPEQEQVDLVAVIAWLGAQEWCDGNVGMYGTSYSGFNALQIACERPPELKAVVAIYASDDRYTDDVHYLGGALKWLDLVDYCHYVTPMNALPPVPAVYGEGWRDEWLARLDWAEPWLFAWLEHQQDDGYWRHGSLRPAYDRIECAVMVVAGWADGYRNNSFRTMEALGAAGVPRRLLAGPWAHVGTESSLPGPRIDLVPEMVRWWDRWLRGVDNGVDSAPVVDCFVRSSTRPSPVLDTHEGSWVSDDWPSARSTIRLLELDARAPYAGRPDVGVDAWISCAGHLPYGQSSDQRFDDAASLTWEWDGSGLELMGHSRARLQVVSSAPVAQLSVKLCDVFADGTSALVTRGLLNLTHRAGHAVAAEPLPVGVPVEVEVELEAAAYRFAPGQKLRLSVAGADWPNTAAPPEPVVLTVLGGTLELATLVGSSTYPVPEFVAGNAAGEASPDVVWRVERDVVSGVTRCVVDHGSTYPVELGTVVEHYAGSVSIDPVTYEQRAQADVSFALTWPEVAVRVQSTLDVTADAQEYRVEITLTAEQDGELVRERSWSRAFPRDLA